MSTAKKKLTTCAPKTAVAYARYSSAKQRDVSIEQQLADIHVYAEREGYTIIHDYADRAKSGFKRSDRRAEFQAMLRAANTGLFDTVIAWKVDRFGRDRRESANFKGQLADNGVSVVYAMEPIPDGAVGCLTEGMLEAIAEWYSRNLSENVHRGKIDNANKCLFNGVKIYGYEKGPDNKYVINESEAAIVRQVFSMYSRGMTIRDIKLALEAQGVVSKFGNPFCETTVGYMLQNDSYLGIYKYEDIRIPGGIPRIIDQETWDLCQALRKKTYRHSEKRKYDFYFTGKCYCSRCHTRLTGSSGNGRGGNPLYYYVCYNRKHANCDLPNHRKDKLEKRVFDFLLNDVLNGEMLGAFTDAVAEAMNRQRAVSPIHKMEQDLKDINRRINNMTRAVSEGIWTDATASMLKDLTNQAERLRNDIAFQKITDSQIIARDRIEFFFRKIAEQKVEDEAFKKALVARFINSIVVYDDWLEIVVNADSNVEQIPPDKLPPLEAVPDLSRFGYCTNGAGRLFVVEPYPVVAFKIAI